MGKTYPQLDAKLTQFIEQQKMFFVATAPLAADGHVNVSPKGYDSFAILGPNKVAYLDIGGSGIETQAHVQENQRITLMFCAFEGAANIVRIYGQGTAIGFEEPDFEELMKLFPAFSRARAIILIDIDKVMDSCGWGVPFFEFKGERDQLVRWSNSINKEDWAKRRYARNAESLDGLPGLIPPKKKQ